MRVVKALCCAVVLTAMFAPGARADEWDKKTILTFSGAVQIPGATLPAGSYVFKLADLAGNRHVVQVFDKGEKKIIATLMAIPNQRMTPTDKPVIMFSERPAGSPVAVKVWYYPGERIGNEFVYPKRQAMRIAKETHQRVLSTNDEPAANTNAADSMTAMKSASVGYFDESGEWQADNGTVATTGVAEPTVTDREPSTTMAKAEPAPAPTARRRHLPRTASNLGLFELLSGLAIAGGLAARQLRKMSPAA